MAEFILIVARAVLLDADRAEKLYYAAHVVPQPRKVQNAMALHPLVERFLAPSLFPVVHPTGISG